MCSSDLTVPQALALMPPTAVEGWLIHALDIYDREGLYHGSAALKNVDGYAHTSCTGGDAVSFEEVSGILVIFLRGLSGRPLRVACGPDIFTDTETIHLPPRVALFPERDRNFQVYKAMAAHQWAQTRFGTFDANLVERFAGESDPAGAQSAFHALETIRLDACIGRRLPGLARTMLALRESRNAADELPVVAHALSAEGATVHDTLAALKQLPPGIAIPRDRKSTRLNSSH